jgi:hypothetical protein
VDAFKEVAMAQDKYAPAAKSDANGNRISVGTSQPTICRRGGDRLDCKTLVDSKGLESAYGKTLRNPDRTRQCTSLVAYYIEFLGYDVSSFGDAKTRYNGGGLKTTMQFEKISDITKLQKGDIIVSNN